MAQASSIAVERHGLLALVALGLFAGGGGSPAPLPEMVIICACGVYLALLAAQSFFRGSAVASPSAPQRQPDWVLTLLICATLALPVLQLLPMPPALWHALPGREVVVANLALVEGDQDWRPISIAPQATLGSLLAMIPLVVVAFGVARLPPEWQGKALGLIVVAGIAAALLGVLQLASSGMEARIYANSHPAWITGLHANRNAAADLFLAALCSAAALASLNRRGRRARRVRIALVLMGFLLAIATVFTASRAGIALLAGGALVGAVWLAMSYDTYRDTWRKFGWVGMAAATVGMIAAIYALGGGRLGVIASRFAATDDPRLSLWQTGLEVVENYWPIGSGMGTFVNAFLPLEPLESVDSSIPNRAHSEYLELAIEGGLPAVIVGLVVLLCLVALWVRAKQGEAVQTAMRRGAVAILLIFALHAFVDYPLRNLSGMTVVGIALGLLAARRPKPVWLTRREAGIA